MLKFSREQLAVGWCAAILVLSAVAIIAGVGITMGNAAVMLLTCIAPPTVMMLVWSGPPPPTVAEVLHAAQTPATGDRR